MVDYYMGSYCPICWGSLSHESQSMNRKILLTSQTKGTTEGLEHCSFDIEESEFGVSLPKSPDVSTDSRCQKDSIDHGLAFPMMISSPLISTFTTQLDPKHAMKSKDTSVET